LLVQVVSESPQFQNFGPQFLGIRMFPD